MQELAGRMRESLRALAGVFRNRDLRRLQLASMGSVIGNWGYLIALFVYAYDQGGAAAVGLVGVIRMIPAALAAPLTGSLADRFDRRRVMISADVVRAALHGGAAVTIWLDGPPAVVYCIVGLSTITSTVFLPAEAALLPSLVRSPGELTAANVAQSTVLSTAEFVGPAVGGLLLVATNIPVVFMVNGSSFVWSAALVMGIHGRGSPAAETPCRHRVRRTDDAVATALRRGDGRGARDFLRIASCAFSGALAAQMLVVGALEVLVVVVAFDLLGTRRRRNRLPQRRDRSGGRLWAASLHSAWPPGTGWRRTSVPEWHCAALPLVLIGASNSTLVTLGCA